MASCLASDPLAVQVLQIVRRSAATSDWPGLEADLENARVVLGWCVDRTELGLGANLLWELGTYLVFRGGGKEWHEWRQRLLALPEASRPSISRARLLGGIFSQGYISVAERDRIAADHEEAIGLSRELDDTTCLARSLMSLAQLRLIQARYDDAVPLAEEALTLFTQLGLAGSALTVRGYLVSVTAMRGELNAAENLLAASRAQVGTGPAPATLKMQEAYLARARGDDAQERLFLEQFVREVGIEQSETSPNRLFGLAQLASVVQRQGDTEAAAAACAESLAVQHRIGPSSYLWLTLQTLAEAAAHVELLRQSTQLLAAITMERMAIDWARSLDLETRHAAAVESMRAALGEAAFAEASAEGEALSPDAVIELGLAVVAELQQLLAGAAVSEPA